MLINDVVRQRIVDLAADRSLPAYVYDLDGLRSHLSHIREALGQPGAPELTYAAKANPDPAVLTALAPFVDGVEVASAGELQHVMSTLPGKPVSFGGPGKTNEELSLACLAADRIHVESPAELTRLAATTQLTGSAADVLLRVNLAADTTGAALTMSGPFGMDPDAMSACRAALGDMPGIRLRGVHAHLASGLGPESLAAQAEVVLAWARDWLAEAPVAGPREINLGGGMAVDYRQPDVLFDWAEFGKRISALAMPGETLRIEPGRALTAYCAWYATEVIDVKYNHGACYAVVRGGTHHLRTPAAKGHSQPFVVLPAESTTHRSATDTTVTVVGQLCTPKDVLAREVRVPRIAVGDVVVFGLAGAYAWNISHHDFLMHPPPQFSYVGATSKTSTHPKRDGAAFLPISR